MTINPLPRKIRVLGESDHGLYVLILRFLSIIAAISNVEVGHAGMRAFPSYFPTGEGSSVFLEQLYAHHVLGTLMSSLVRPFEFFGDFSAYVSSAGMWLLRGVRFD